MTQVTEIERAAITLLHNAYIEHPGLRAWAEAMGTNPDEQRHIDKFIVDNGDLVQAMEAQGYTTPSHEFDRTNSAFSAIINGQPRGLHPESDDDYYVTLADEAAARLAYALYEYRTGGRPTGDQIHDIQGLDSVIARVSTSLAAAVAEYHQQMMSLMSLQINDIEDAS